MRVYVRGGRGWGVSVELLGGLALLLLVAVTWTIVAGIIVVCLLLAGIGYAARVVWQRARRH
jgi:hypothetical protein